MDLADFDYDLPDDLIAQTPVEPRDSARLLVDQGAAEPLHRTVRDLTDHLHEGDLLVVNDSRVIPARLRLRRETGGAAEVLLLEPLDADRRTWEALVRPGAKVKPGATLIGSADAPLVEMIGRSPAGDTFHIAILGDGDPLAILEAHGEMPLPPYITTPLQAVDRYQTVYADRPGSAAAPTAGLHLTPELLGALSDQGVEMARVELVVGLDTFQPISEADPLNHTIHSERYAVSEETLERCRAARRVVAVGTTAVRALESAATFDRREGRTELYIHRGYEWKVVDVLMTNFHLPRTTLLLMIDAFVGPRWRRLYADAIGQRYRFLSFGDAMLLDRHQEADR
jgi:S-adenosylmethionine:tRNA ribosyltransferase-isomerase